jgi:DNA polymerase III delta prime subunit
MTTLLPIHKEIQEKLEYFHSIHKIPNIIFNGPSGSGKKTIVQNFIKTIYENDKERIKNFVMYVNCAHGKGIKFIREELKFFAKTHINSNGGDIFKSIVLLNADKLTMDAQSALRRCIELFNHTTRFFIIVEDKYTLLKPILSRFCEIYVSEPIYKNNSMNLYKHNLSETFKFKKINSKRIDGLKKVLDIQSSSSEECINLSNKLYQKGYCAIDVIKILEDDSVSSNIFPNISNEKKYELLFYIYKVKREFRNEKLLLFFILHFLFLSLDTSLENIALI